MATFYVSVEGDDRATGTEGRPFRTVQKGINALEAGDVLLLHSGHYFGTVRVLGKQGTPEKPILIRSVPGERAFLDGCLDRFSVAGNDEWQLARPTLPTAHDDEYISTRTVDLLSLRDRVNRGAFFTREPYTRLITYDKLEDLRAENQTWNLLPMNDERGWQAFENGSAQQFRYPWVYMGPGLFFDAATRRVHVRLSHTKNGVSGLADYDGETDPRRVPLAISNNDTTPLTVKDSTFVRFEDLTVRFGGEVSLRVTNSHRIDFDQVRFDAATHGITLQATTGVVISNCEIRGGLPAWYFRSDRKGEYQFILDDAVLKNQLGKETSRALLNSGEGNGKLEIHHCELVDGHDIILSGKFVRFHHNWVHNLNDEGLIVDHDPTAELSIFRNVITQSLSAISFAGKGGPGGTRFVFRNLIDLRSPTGSRRPRHPGDAAALRAGHLYKGGDPQPDDPILGEDGPIDFFHNTCLVRDLHDRKASYTHYENTRDRHPRRSFNNIFIAANSNRHIDRAITILPPATFPGPTDGNCYFRIGSAEEPLLRVLEPSGRFFETLDAYRYSELFAASRTQYPPGYEAVSIEADPRFRRIAGDGAPLPDDDLRLRGDSPARNAGIRLEADLEGLDPDAPPDGHPDIGCYAFDSPGLRVGVRGRQRFPRQLQPFPLTP